MTVLAHGEKENCKMDMTERAYLAREIISDNEEISLTEFKELLYNFELDRSNKSLTDAVFNLTKKSFELGYYAGIRHKSISQKNTSTDSPSEPHIYYGF